jgi:hypothetical protein
MSILGLSVVAALGYLLVVAILAIAVLVVVRSGRKGQAGGCTGCAIALAILVAAGLGAAGCTAVVLLGAGSEAIRHGPVRSISIEREPARPAPSAERGARTERGRAAPAPGGRFPVRLRIELDGDVDVARLSRWIRDRLDGDVSLTYDTRPGPDGRPRTSLEFGLPIDPADMARFERELREELPELDLPRAVRIEIRRAGE